MSGYNREQIFNLLTGVAGVMSVYWISGLLHQQLISQTFTNSMTGKEQKFTDMVPLVLFPALFTWILGQIYNYKLTDRVHIPTKNSLSCAAIVFISGFSLNIAISRTSYPVVMAFKSSNILAVLLVAIFCTRVRDKSLNLPAKKFIIGFIIAVGVFLFGYFDPESKTRQTKSQLIGIFMILVTMLADGFLPDFQAQIKSQFKPQPSQMMVEINKYLTLVSFFATILSFQLWDTLTFMIFHPWFVVILFCFSVSGFLGQLFIYRMIKQFKQHVVPLVVTIRKIFTILINVIYFHHKTSLLQLIGMVIVTAAIFTDFCAQVRTEKKQEKFQKVTEQSEQIETDRANLSVDQQKQ